MDAFPLITSTPLSFPTGQTQTRPQSVSLPLGQSFQGTVSSQTGLNQYTFNVNNQALSVESAVPLKVGQQLTVQVVASSPQLQLQIIPTTSLNQRIGTSLHLLVGQSSLSSQLSSLTASLAQGTQLSESSFQTFQAISQLMGMDDKTSSGEASINGQSLQQTVQRLGLDMESLFSQGKVQEAANTLKYALLELSQQTDSPASQVSQAEDLLNSIQLYQLLQLRLATDAVLFLPLPLPFLDQGFLLIDTEQEKNADHTQQQNTASPRVSLHLQLEGLGNLQVNIQESSTDQLSIIFYTEDAERAKFMGNFREELEQWLTTERQCSVQFLVGTKEPIKTLLEKLVQGSTGMVNISI